jgi:hypothetical protein
MTPAQIEQSARRYYNAVGDTFHGQDEILDSIYHAEIQLVQAGLVIEASYTTPTVADQQEYTFPTNAESIKRITYEGAKLQPIDFREDDLLTLSDADTTSTGTPSHYFTWNNTIYLRPIPAAVGTLKIFSYDKPQAVTSNSTLEVPAIFHMGIVDFVLAQMYAKDKDFQTSEGYMQRWDNPLGHGHIQRAKQLARKKKRGDHPAYVKDEESLAAGLLGSL